MDCKLNCAKRWNSLGPGAKPWKGRVSRTSLPYCKPKSLPGIQVLYLAQAESISYTMSTPQAASANTVLGSQVTLYYRTGWRRARVHGSAGGESWKDYEMFPVTSAPGKWLLGRVPLPNPLQNGKVPALEFVINDCQDDWDKPPEGGNYVISRPGTYSLRNGEIHVVNGPPVMIVSDLDGTMVGDDSSTAAFKTYWEDVAVLRGGVLVYNTGRSLDSFLSLMREKSSCLAHPDILISAVGTKIYNYKGKTWEEDHQWVKLLDKEWDVQVVREAAYSSLAKVGKERMHFRPPEEQNDHKVTCGVHIDALQQVVDHVSTRLAAAGVNANIIHSGTGDWRFLDLVPRQAGKLEALEYVRKKHNFPLHNTIACGDSGNDILMLSGQNRALVVGNAQPDLVKWVADQQQTAGQVAGSVGVNGDAKERLLMATKKEALGILEGLEYWGLK